MRVFALEHRTVQQRLERRSSSSGTSLPQMDLNATPKKLPHDDGLRRSSFAGWRSDERWTHAGLREPAAVVSKPRQQPPSAISNQDRKQRQDIHRTNIVTHQQVPMDDEKKKYDEPEIAVAVASAEPIKTEATGPPIPPGHSRFYCSQCHTVCWRKQAWD